MNNKAWNHSELESQKIERYQPKKFNNIKKQLVWRKILKNHIFSHLNVHKKQVVFKIKHKSVYQEWLVACFSPVLGVNSSQNYSPMKNDITFCILLLMVITFGFLAKVVNIKTAFLYGNLKKIDLYGMFPRHEKWRIRWLNNLKQVYLWSC